jgi:hypothetical protein
MEWISIKSKLPENNAFDDEDIEYYFIYTENFGIQKAMFIDNEWWSNYLSKIMDNVTHWLEIELPKD